MKFIYLLLCLPILINVVLAISADRSGSSSKKHSNVVVSKIHYFSNITLLFNIIFILEPRGEVSADQRYGTKIKRTCYNSG